MRGSLDEATKTQITNEHALKYVESLQQKEKVLKKRKAGEVQTKESLIENEEAQSKKLLVKNLAFEATANEVRELFLPFGHIKKVRLPKKVNSENHRGFGFVEYATKEEAKLAFKELQNTHLYSRKLVIEYAKSS